MTTLTLTVIDNRTVEGTRINRVQYVDFLKKLKDKIVKIETFIIKGERVEPIEITYNEAVELLKGQVLNK